MKVVIDTNILVSPLVFPGGRANGALRRIIEQKDQLLLSMPILDKVKLLSLHAYLEDVL
ncbi:MAG: hypothetical protein ABI619_10440 [Betaproteobacteria bacterium]